MQVLVELPAPVVNDTKLTVEDFLQELKCSINIKHRFVYFLFFLLTCFQFFKACWLYCTLLKKLELHLLF
jgi:hypothetical protein